MTFEAELDNFRMEEDAAQQYFFGYLSLQLIPGANPAVLSRLNRTPGFWITTRYSLLLSAFVAMGRIFDQDARSIHNINKLLGSVSANLPLFTRGELLKRRIADGADPGFAASYVADKYDLTVTDVRDMRKAVLAWRRVYEARYRDVRHLVFAHRGIPRSQIDALMSQTRVDEMKEMLGFLHALFLSLDELYRNGRKPDLAPRLFVLPPTPNWTGSMTAGERVFRESMEMQFDMLTVPDAGRDDE